jgi:hypothetical protein
MFLRKFQISAALFWGWQSILDIEIYDTIEKIVAKVQSDLKQFFRNANLLELAEKVDKMQLHCHNDIQRMFIDFPNEIIYLCDHC